MGKRSSNFVVGDNSSGDERPAKVTKTAKNTSGSNGTENVDDEGNTFWELSNKRRIVVQKFKGNMYVNLREYYEDKKTGGMKPGMKGLMLSIEQYQTLLNAVPDINKELRKNGIDIGDKNVEENAANDPDEKPIKPIKKEKANIEATSDEAEDSSE